jgi:hypothetical protein
MNNIIIFVLLAVTLYLLGRCHMLQLKLKDAKRYINYGDTPKYNVDLIGKPVKPKYRKQIKNVKGIIVKYESGDRVIVRILDNPNQYARVTNSIIWAATSSGAKVDLIETAIIDNESNVVVRYEYELM